MRAKVIFNPHANRGRAKEQMAGLNVALAANRIEHQLVVLARKGQAKQEAAAATFGRYDAVIAAGGDGTVHEVLNGLIEVSADRPTIPLGIMPLGTANDFSDMTGLPRDLAAAAEVIAGRNIRQVDAGWVSFATENGAKRGKPAWQGCFFGNNCALAMEPLVTLEADKLSRLSGNVRYGVAVARCLFRMQAWHMRICWDGGAFEGSTYLMSVANTPRTGGFFLVAPDAAVDDGLFTFVFAPELPMTEVMRLLPGLLKGTHISHPKVITARTAQLHIRSRPGTPIHADGEIIAKSADVINYRILPGKISLIGP